MHRDVVLQRLPGVGLDEVAEVPLRAVDDGVAQRVLDDRAHVAAVVERDAGPHHAEPDLAGEARLPLLDDVDAAHKQVLRPEVHLVLVGDAEVLLLPGEDDGEQHLFVGHLQVGAAAALAQERVDVVAREVHHAHRDPHLGGPPAFAR